MVKTLLRGGTFIAYDESNSDLKIISNGAMLFDDSIIAISPTIDGLDEHKDGVTVVNTEGKIISPGFIDTHRHTWQTAFRTLGPDEPLLPYLWHFGSPGPAATHFTPSDVYIGTLMGTLEGLNAGVTTTVDFAHMTWSREHAVQALEGAKQSGARAYWCYGINPVVKSEEPFTVDFYAGADQLQHIVELAKQNPFNNGLVNLGIAFDGFSPNDPFSKSVIETARDHSLKLITTHMVGGPYQIANQVVAAVNAIPVNPPALDPSLAIIFAHGTDVDTNAANLLRQYDQYISITPESEMHYGHGHPHNHLVQDQSSLGVDTHFTFSIDMITQMRIWLQSTRLRLYQARLDTFKLPSETPMKVKQAFLLGTRNGALALKRPDLGVLKVGARADVLVFSTDSIGLVGWNDPVAAIVLHSNVNDIQEIYVDGKLVKTGGKLVFDWEGKGYGKQLKESAERFRVVLEKTKKSGTFETGIKTVFGIKDDVLAPPFQVNVNRIA